MLRYDIGGLPPGDLPRDADAAMDAISPRRAILRSSGVVQRQCSLGSVTTSLFCVVWTQGAPR